MGCGASKPPPSLGAESKPPPSVEAEAPPTKAPPASAEPEYVTGVQENRSTTAMYASTEPAAPPDQEQGWEERFAPLGLLSVKDVDAGYKVIDDEGQEQVRDEARAPFWTLLGSATPPPPGFPEAPEALTTSKMAWMAMFDSKDAYHDGEHRARTAANGFDDRMKEAMLSGEMTDLAGGHRGECSHLELAPRVSSEGALFAFYVTLKAKDADGAAQVVALYKARLAELRGASGALRFTLFAPPGDVPPQFQDPLTVRWVEQWAAASDVPAAVPPAILELADESSVVTYANTKHYAKPA